MHTSGKMQKPCLDSRWVGFFGLVWFGFWFGLVWISVWIGLDHGLVWFGLWFGLVFGLDWFGLVWLGLDFFAIGLDQTNSVLDSNHSFVELVHA